LGQATFLPRSVPSHMLLDLHQDELRLVIEVLDGHSVCAAAQSCRRLHELASDIILWQVLLHKYLESHRVSAAGVVLASKLQSVRVIKAALAHPAAWWLRPRLVTQRSTNFATNEERAATPSTGSSSPPSPSGPPPACAVTRRAREERSAGALRLSVRYTGAQLGDNRAVRCDPPLPLAPFDTLRFVGHGSGHQLTFVKGCTIAYYEVTVGKRPEDALADSVDCIAIGLASGNFPLSGQQPGWDGGSFGYHSDDGCFFHGSGTRAQAFGPCFKTGDVIGCGYSVLTRQVFFTLNGRFLGAPATVRASLLPLYAVVGVDSHATVRFNFGHSPFLCDLDALPHTLLSRPSPPRSSMLRWLQVSSCFS